MVVGRGNDRGRDAVAGARPPGGGHDGRRDPLGPGALLGQCRLGPVRQGAGKSHWQRLPADPDPDARADARPHTERHAPARANTYARADARPHAERHAPTRANTDARADPQADSDSYADSYADAQADTDTDAASHAHADPQANPHGEPRSEASCSHTHTDARPDRHPDPDRDTGRDADRRAVAERESPPAGCSHDLPHPERWRFTDRFSARRHRVGSGG
jgi:hypothetical protein